MIEFEFESTPETDAMLKQICLRAIKLASNIVRCKDCKYWDETYFYHSEDDAMQRCICRKHNNIFMTADDFCSRGERREEI